MEGVIPEWAIEEAKEILREHWDGGIEFVFIARALVKAYEKGIAEERARMAGLEEERAEAIIDAVMST